MGRSHFVERSWIRVHCFVGLSNGRSVLGCMYRKERDVFIRGRDVEEGSKRHDWVSRWEWENNRTVGAETLGMEPRTRSHRVGRISGNQVIGTIFHMIVLENATRLPATASNQERSCDLAAATSVHVRYASHTLTKMALLEFDCPTPPTEIKVTNGIQE